MATIERVRGFEILDSRGHPTIAAEVVLSDGACGFAAAPSGASTGAREALELRDGQAGRYLGKGVTKAVANVNGELSAALVGRSAEDQAASAGARPFSHCDKHIHHQPRDAGGLTVEKNFTVRPFSKPSENCPVHEIWAI